MLQMNEKTGITIQSSQPISSASAEKIQQIKHLEKLTAEYINAKIEYERNFKNLEESRKTLERTQSAFYRARAEHWQNTK